MTSQPSSGGQLTMKSDFCDFYRNTGFKYLVVLYLIF